MRQCPSYTDVIWENNESRLVSLCENISFLESSPSPVVVMFYCDVLCQWDICRTSHCSIRWVLGVWWCWTWVSRLLASSLFTLWCRQLLGLRGTQQHYTHVHVRTSTESSQAGMDMWVLATMLLTTLGSFFNNVEFWVWSEFGWCYGKQISGNVPHLSQKLPLQADPQFLISYTLLKYIFKMSWLIIKMSHQ